LLLASDRIDRTANWSHLAVRGEVDTISTSDIPEAPADHFAGIVVDINLRSPESVQLVRNKLRAEAYRSSRGCSSSQTPFITGSMQAGRWARRIRYRGV